MRPPSISTSSQNDGLSSSKSQPTPSDVPIKRCFSTLLNDGRVISKIDSNINTNIELNLPKNGNANLSKINDISRKTATTETSNRTLSFSTSFSSSVSSSSSAFASLKRISSDLDKHNTITKSNEKVPLLVNKKIITRKKDSIAELVRNVNTNENNQIETVVSSVARRHIKPKSDIIFNDNLSDSGTIFKNNNRLYSDNRRSLQLPLDYNKIFSDKEHFSECNQKKRRQQIHSWYASEYSTLIEELENETKVII